MPAKRDQNNGSPAVVYPRLDRGRGRAEVREYNSPSPTRPIRLFARPEPIDATAELPDGPPAQFTWRRVRHIVVHAEGPERIATQWWRDERGRALTRDYFRVESRDGVRVWLFQWPGRTFTLVRARRVRMSNVVAFPQQDESVRAEPGLPVPGYAELAVTTNFSFLRGASHPEDLVRQAEALGLAGIGIADRNSVAGVVRAYSAFEQLKEYLQNENPGIALPPFKLAVGARLVFADGTPDILAYPQNRKAWGRLTRLLTVGKSRGEKAECILFIDDLLEHIAGLNLIVMPPARLKSDTLGGRTDAPAVRIFSAAGLARRRHALSRRRQSAARAPQGRCRDDIRSADRRERRALPRTRAAAIAGRHDLHPRARHDRPGRPSARSQCGTASERPPGDGAHFPPRAGCGSTARCASSTAATSRSAN